MTYPVYLIAAARTAIGSFGGTLQSVAPVDLGIHATQAAVERSAIDPSCIASQVVGHVIRTEVKDAYMARRITLGAQLPLECQSLTLNRLCGSGLEAITFATQQIQLGEVSAAVAGGTESMSRSGHLMTTNRWGQRMGDSMVQDELTGALTDPFGVGHMGVTAENLAERYNIGREQQDEFALESQRRAATAIENGYFQSQIAPIELRSKKATHIFDTDEHPRATTLEALSGLRPAFKTEGSVTAGNASGINDGAAMVVLADEQTVSDQNIAPMARIVSYGRCGVANDIMGIGPVGASQRALQRAGLNVNELDVVESNEAFAAQALSVAKELEFDPANTNPNGGAIALGHPIGASGAVLMTKLAYELIRVKGRYGLVTLCIGGGQGIAMVIENLQR